MMASKLLGFMGSKHEAASFIWVKCSECGFRSLGLRFFFFLVGGVGGGGG